MDWSRNVNYPSHHFLHIHRLLALHGFFSFFLRLLSHCARALWLLLQGYGADKISEMSHTCQMLFCVQLKPEVGRHIFQRIAFLLFLLFLFVLIIHVTTTGPCQSMPSRKQSSAGVAGKVCVCYVLVIVEA